MKKLLLFGLFLFPAIKAFGNAGDVTVIQTISPKNYPNSFLYVVRSTNVFVDTTTFSVNLSSNDIDLQHALNTIDRLSTSGGGGSGSMRYEQDGSLVVNTTTTNIISPLAVVTAGGKALVYLTANLPGGSTSYLATTIQYVSSVTANSPLIANTVGTSGSTVTISLSNNLPGGSTSYINSTAQYVASVTANSPLSASTIGTSGSTVTITLTSNLPSGSTNYIQNRNTLQSGATAFPSFIYVGSSLTTPILVDSGLTSGQCVQTGTAGLLTVTGSPCSTGTGGGGAPISVGTGTAANYTNQVSSPTTQFSFLGSQFNDTASGTTNFIALNLTSVTVQGTLYPGSFVSFGTASGSTTINALPQPATFQYVSSVTANSPLSASTVGTSGSTVTITLSNNLPGGSTSYLSPTIQYVASVTANSPLSASTIGIAGSTVTITLTNNIPSGSTSYIQNRSTLQSGATFYTSNGNVQGIFSIIQNNNDVVDSSSSIQSLITNEGASNMYHSIFWYGINPNPPSNGGEFVITTSSIPLTSSVGSITDKLDRPEIAMATKGNNGNSTPYVALRSTGKQFPNSAPVGDFAVIGSTNIAYSILQLNYAGSSLPVCTDANKTLTTSGCSSSGGSSSLAVATGNLSGFTSVASSPTAVINFSSDTFNATLRGGATAFITLNTSSVTTQGTFYPGSNISFTTAAGSTTINATGTGGTTIPGNPDTSIQMNQGGIFVGTQTLTYLTTSNLLTIGATTQFNNVSTTTWTNISNVNFGTGTIVTVSGSLTVDSNSTTTIRGEVLDSSLSAGTSGQTYISQGTGLAPKWAPSSKLNLVFDAVDAKITSSSSPYVSNSTSEFSPALYYADSSTQSVTFTGLIYGYGSGPLSLDIIYNSTTTSNFTCWGIYTATNTPNVTTSNYNSSTYNIAVTTSLRNSANQLALIKATVGLSNTTVSNGDLITIKLEREHGGCAGDSEAVGYAQVKKVRLYE